MYNSESFSCFLLGQTDIMFGWNVSPHVGNRSVGARPTLSNSGAEAKPPLFPQSLLVILMLKLENF